jgi:hypothetical protein
MVVIVHPPLGNSVFKNHPWYPGSDVQIIIPMKPKMIAPRNQNVIARLVFGVKGFVIHIYGSPIGYKKINKRIAISLFFGLSEKFSCNLRVELEKIGSTRSPQKRQK